MSDNTAKKIDNEVKDAEKLEIRVIKGEDGENKEMVQIPKEDYELIKADIDAQYLANKIFSKDHIAGAVLKRLFPESLWVEPEPEPQPELSPEEKRRQHALANPGYAKINYFLDMDLEDKRREKHARLSHWDNAIHPVLFDRWLKSRFKTKDEFDTGMMGITDATYVNVDTSADESENLLYSGFVQCVDHNYKTEDEEPKKCIVSLSPGSHITVIGAEEDEFYVDLMIEDFKTFCKTNHPFKGRLVKLNDAGEGEFISPKGMTWDDVILPEETVDSLRRNIVLPLTQPEILKEHGIVPRRGVLFEGHPGTGKSLTAQILGEELNQHDVTFLWVTPRNLERGANGVSHVFRVARELSPCILLLEDMDLYANTRRNGNQSTTMGELLAQLDGAMKNEGIVVIGTTNYPDKIEEALRDRPNRFDRQVRFDTPVHKARVHILEKFTKNTELADDVDLDKIADMTEGYTGAYLADVVKTAIMARIMDMKEDGKVVVKQEHLVSAVNEITKMKKRFAESANFQD